jgi:pimeloyl-ACP methyl ester carboxylesterase
LTPNVVEAICRNSYDRLSVCMTSIIIAAALLGAGAVVTLIGTALIGWLHPPSGRFIAVGGSRQHVLELGQERSTPPLVLIHGASCNLEDMRLALGERLAARHRVILVDRPGLGWSGRRAGEGSSPSAQAAVLRAVLDQLGVSRAIIVGHSWGGALALAFALDHPERVAGLVLLAPPTHPWLRRATRLYDAAATPFAGWLFARTLALPFGVLLIGLVLRLVFLPQRPPQRYVSRAASMLVLRPATFLANARDVSHLKGFLTRQVARYPTLVPPTTIITGDSDNTVSAQSHSMTLAAEVPGAKLVVLPGFGHMLHHAAADRIIAEIEEMAQARAPR